MGMQINVNPAELSQEQREAVAGFILAYPAKCAGTCGSKPQEIPEGGGGGGGSLPIYPVVTAGGGGSLPMHLVVGAGGGGAGSGKTPALSPSVAGIVKDDDEFQAFVAFGRGGASPEAALAFGSASSPLAQSATAAPSTAVAGQLPIVPAATPEISFGATSSVPAPPAPITAPAASAPTAPAAPTTPASGVEVDKHGLPWDGRIHAGTKRKNADGSWTAKRGVESALVDQVEAELRAVMGAPAAPLAPAGAPTATTPVTSTPPLANGAGVAPAPTVSAPSADARQQFVGLVGRAAAALQAGKLTQVEVTQCCTDVGVPALPLLANRLDLVPQVAAAIDALIASRQ